MFCSKKKNWPGNAVSGGEDDLRMDQWTSADVTVFHDTGSQRGGFQDNGHPGELTKLSFVVLEVADAHKNAFRVAVAAHGYVWSNSCSFDELSEIIDEHRDK